MKKKVLAWIPLGISDGRETFRGISQYARLHAPGWEIMQAHPSQFPLEKVMSWEVDGLIGNLRTAMAARQALQITRFCVNLHGRRTVCRLPQAGVDDNTIGETAARYLLKQGFRHFAYFGMNGLDASDERWRGYKQYLQSRGHAATRFTAPGFNCEKEVPPNYKQMIQPALTEWILQQPRPFALFIMDDYRTSQIYSTCRDSGLAIPDDIALLGVNDDDIHCMTNVPPLSSIQVPARVIGYRAAQMLDRLFRGEKLVQKTILLQPGEVIERASTAVFRLDDPQLLKALRYIRENAARAVSTEEIARAAGLSRRVLEKRLRIRLNTSPQNEVRRARVELARTALRETSLSLEDIAEATGFTSGNYLSQIFKKTTGLTPGSYRRNFR